MSMISTRREIVSSQRVKRLREMRKIIKKCFDAMSCDNSFIYSNDNIMTSLYQVEIYVELNRYDAINSLIQSNLYRCLLTDTDTASKSIDTHFIRYDTVTT